jgi:hypothetical protein
MSITNTKGHHEARYQLAAGDQHGRVDGVARRHAHACCSRVAGGHEQTMENEESFNPVRGTLL